MRINLMLFLFRLAGVLAVPVLAMGLFTDYYIFLGIWGNYNIMSQVLLKQVPALLVFAGTPIAAYKKYYPFLWMSLLYLPFAFSAELKYLTSSNAIYFFYMKLYSAMAVTTEILSLIAFILWQYQKHKKIIGK